MPFEKSIFEDFHSKNPRKSKNFFLNWSHYQGLNFIFYKIFCIFTFKFFCTLGCFKIFNFQNFTLKQVRARKFDFTPLICNVERYFMRSFIKIEIGVKKVISQCKFNHKNFWNTLTLTFFKKKIFHVIFHIWMVKFLLEHFFARQKNPGLNRTRNICKNSLFFTFRHPSCKNGWIGVYFWSKKIFFLVKARLICPNNGP